MVAKQELPFQFESYKNAREMEDKLLKLHPIGSSLEALLKTLHDAGAKELKLATKIATSEQPIFVSILPRRGDNKEKRSEWFTHGGRHVFSKKILSGFLFKKENLYSVEVIFDENNKIEFIRVHSPRNVKGIEIES